MSTRHQSASLVATAAITTIACSLIAYGLGYAIGRKKQHLDEVERRRENDDKTKLLYFQRRHRGRLSFTSTDDDDDEMTSSTTGQRGDLCANNWHHFEVVVEDVSTGGIVPTSRNNKSNRMNAPPRPAGATLRSSHPMHSTSGMAVSEEEDDLTQPLEGEDRRRVCHDTESSDNDEMNTPRPISKNTPRLIHRSRSTVRRATHEQPSGIIYPPVPNNDGNSTTKTPVRLPQRVSVPRRAAVRPSPSRSPRKARTQYNARIMPHRLILIRHGQSRGNVDESLYATTPDNAMNLTEFGWHQAKASGVHLKNVLCKNWEAEGIHFILSPYVRTVETFHGILSAWIDPAEITGEHRMEEWYKRLAKLGLEWHEDPRLREQDFGNFQDPKVIQKAKKDRHRYGPFYYRFPHGESASDVFDRVSTFLDSLWRSFDVNDCRNYVLVTHGISIRVILARYFRYTIDQFHLMANPRNCEIVTLRHDGRGKLVLSGRHELHFDQEKEENDVERIIGYKSHKQLRCLPSRSIRKTAVRMSFEDQQQ